MSSHSTFRNRIVRTYEEYVRVPVRHQFLGVEQSVSSHHDMFLHDLLAVCQRVCSKGISDSGLYSHYLERGYCTGRR